MNKWQASCVCAAVYLGCMLRFPAVGSADELALHCTTDVQAESNQPAKTAILLTVTLTNTGKEPIRYPVLLGMGNYPDAGWFKAQVTDAKGKVQEVEMSNDSVGGISGGTRQILPGQSVVMPAAIQALPSGVYKIQIREGKSVQVTVKDDQELARKWTEQIVAKIRKGDSFAKYVARWYPTDYLTDALFQELSSDDIEAAFRATWPLEFIRPPLPPKASAYIKKAMQKQLDLAKEGRHHTGVVGALAFLASEIGSDEALEPVLALARTENLRGEAVKALGEFKQEKAAKELQRFLNDEDEKIQWHAAQALAKRKDPAALEVLLIVVQDPQRRLRRFALKELVKFGEDPRVEPAIKSRLNDPEKSVRSAAEFALQQLRPAKKP